MNRKPTSSMTPAQMKGNQPFVNLLTDVRTQMAALIVAVNALTATFQSRQQTETDDATRKAAAEVAALRSDVIAVRARQDSTNRALRLVEGLAQVYCLKERDPLARRILECDR